MQGLAQKFVDKELTTDMLFSAPYEEVFESLIKVRGLGRWSVEMFACFGLKRMDIFSTGDLGVQRGMAALQGRDVGKLKNKGGKWKYMSEKEMEEIAEKFRPYRYVVCKRNGFGLTEPLLGAFSCGTLGELRTLISALWRADNVFQPVDFIKISADLS